MTATKIVLLSILAATLAIAGTLDNAPFRIVLPNNSWKLNDSAAQDMGKNVFLVASITSTNTQSKSVIVKTVLDKVAASSLDELSTGMRDSFSNPIVKKLSDEPTTFLGFKARRFTYEVNGTSYNEAVVFVNGNTGWTIMCSGLLGQKVEVENLFTFLAKIEK
jgi:hypothetical protein